MDGQATGSLLRFFKGLCDPRGKNIIHKLHDILVIAICAVICGADGWVEVGMFGKSKLGWFDGGHGRIEVRRIWVSDRVLHLGEVAEQWPALASMAVGQSLGGL